MTRLGPYDLNTIVVGDCLDVMTRMPNGCVDLVFADPPFNLGKKYGKDKDRRVDYWQWVKRWLEECWRVLNTTGSFYYMCLPQHLPFALPLMELWGIFRNVIIWKNATGAHQANYRYWPKYQPIIFYSRDGNTYNAGAQVDPSATRRWDDKMGYKFKGRMGDMWLDIPFVYAGSIIHKEAIIEPGTKRKVHPCQMPEGLAERAILHSTNKDGLVFDPFIGSGTTAVAADRLGRNFFGCDISAPYVEMGLERIAGDRKKRAQLELF